MTLEEWVARFAQNVAAQTDAIRQGDARTGNRHARQYTAALQELRARGDAGREALTMPLTHPRTDVRAMAAGFLLRYRTAEARAVLEAAAKEGGVGALDAIMTLRHWDNGTWALDPE
ncbi:DUF2019 domain-containing protein [Corallococcus praedator]|uniref:DUF2019 domain-containing protein n=1 Tax=Corallococcus praedator TaxID=2316724 RepID=A0ABX9Q8W2_9BACT|nr:MULTISPECIES: DUF2019 domain-containing protein [Corallococcus]RKH25064.1 DUF2019 domain-containing protein [Corallococcus sp. CA031C]RKH94554.1 DUF2019 domain-containing protein [Corallococcus praedator]